jgi:ribonuclease BN (tRNA processing enzyme)
MPLEKLPYPVKVYEFPEQKDEIPFPVEPKFLIHASPCLGYRFELEGKIISYCPDTKICKNAVKLAKNADLLISECTLKVIGRNYEEQNWPHLNPETAAKIAKEAKAKKLALIHFEASIYQTLKERKEAEEFAKKIFKKAFAAIDDMKIEI